MNLTTKLDLNHSAYTIDEIVEWCSDEFGMQHDITWNVQSIDNNSYQFKFNTTRNLVRFGLTWNKISLRYKPKY